MIKKIDLSNKKLNSIYHNMVNRCTVASKESTDNSEFKDASVCEEWLQDKQLFFNWVSENYYEIEGEQMELDKDILVPGNRLYSPETCVFAPKAINSFFRRDYNTNHSLPRGVTEVGTKYRPSIKGYSDTFTTIQEAEEVYLKHRKANAIALADAYIGKIPHILYKAVETYYDKLPEETIISV